MEEKDKPELALDEAQPSRLTFQTHQDALNFADHVAEDSKRCIAAMISSNAIWMVITRSISTSGFCPQGATRYTISFFPLSPSQCFFLVRVEKDCQERLPIENKCLK
jgi:hypothetical protein